MAGTDIKLESQLEDVAGIDAPEAEQTGANRRDHVRIRPDETNRLAATLASGSNVRLIDLSRGGAQFECDRRFLPNATVTLRLITRDGEHPVSGRVVRSRIVRLGSGGLGYLVAVAFGTPLQADLATPGPGDSSSPAPLPPAVTARTQPAGDPAGVTPTGLEAPPAPAEQAPPSGWADISAEEALAFEATTEPALSMLTVTASVDSTSEQLHDMFEGNDW